MRGGVPVIKLHEMGKVLIVVMFVRHEPTSGGVGHGRRWMDQSIQKTKKTLNDRGDFGMDQLGNQIDESNHWKSDKLDVSKCMLFDPSLH